MVANATAPRARVKAHTPQRLRPAGITRNWPCLASSHSSTPMARNDWKTCVEWVSIDTVLRPSTASVAR